MVGRRLVAVLTAGWALLPPDAQACSVCVGWSEGQGLNGGFYWSALLLTALPFAVIAAIGAWAWRAHRVPDPEQAPLEKIEAEARFEARK
jgi:hypothetical protein